MELYKREKINPVSGCLPMLIQIPVFFSLYKVLLGTIEMRQAPFFGWIHDLSAPDPTSLLNLFGLLPFNPHAVLPAFLLFLSIGVWPVIMGMHRSGSRRSSTRRRRSRAAADVRLHAADLHVHAGRSSRPAS